jgi:hypothetical protein
MKLFSRRIRRFNPSTFIVKYDSYHPSAFNYGMQSKLKFVDDLAGALNSALSLVEHGHTNVTVVRQRQVLYSHYQLKQMLKPEAKPMMIRTDSPPGIAAQIWAVAS